MTGKTALAKSNLQNKKMIDNKIKINRFKVNIKVIGRIFKVARPKNKINKIYYKITIIKNFKITIKIKSQN